MKTFLHRIVTAASRKKQVSEAIVQWHGVMRLSKLRAVKGAPGGNAANKAGRIVLRGECEGRPVKVYEAFSEEHAAFISSVSALEQLRGTFPQVYERSGRFVAAEWLSGQSIKQTGFGGVSKPLTMRKLVELQQALHSIAANTVPACGFDYWHDLLRPRFVRAMELVDEIELARRIAATVDAAWAATRRVLMHPDVTPANVVQNPDGQFSIIDNELLTAGGVPLIDLCNTLRAMGRNDAPEYVRMYLDRTNMTITADDIALLEAMWFARCVGSDFVAGQIGTVCLRVQMFKEHKSQLPFSVDQQTAVRQPIPH